MNSKDIFVFIEQKDGVIAPVSHELLAEARKLVAQIPQLHYNVVGVLLGRKIKSLGNTVIAYGADKVIMCDDDKLELYSTQYYTDVLAQIIAEYQPDSFLIGATILGRDLAPRVAARVDTGLTADATKIEMDTTDPSVASLLVTRPAFGGNLFGTIVCRTRPQMATIRPNVFVADQPDAFRSGELICFKAFWDGTEPLVKRKEVIAKETKAVDITKANLIISCGRGMADHLDIAYHVANEIGATVAVSRAVVDAGFAARDIQVGQTGKTVRPNIYIACGISGAAQHVAGMEHSEYIIAINKDPNAAIFSIANLGIIGDAAQILPLLAQELLTK